MGTLEKIATIAGEQHATAVSKHHLHPLMRISEAAHSRQTDRFTASQEDGSANTKSGSVSLECFFDTSSHMYISTLGGELQIHIDESFQNFFEQDEFIQNDWVRNLSRDTYPYHTLGAIENPAWRYSGLAAEKRRLDGFIEDVIRNGDLLSAYYERLIELRDLANEDWDDQKPLSLASLRFFSRFITENNITQKASITITDEGYISAEWWSKKEFRCVITFRGASTSYYFSIPYTDSGRTRYTKSAGFSGVGQMMGLIPDDGKTLFWG